jgi:hypothetical protein
MGLATFWANFLQIHLAILVIPCLPKRQFPSIWRIPAPVDKSHFINIGSLQPASKT